jgi:hypothetical protein
MSQHSYQPKKNRRRGDVAAAISAYLQQNPHAQYFDMLEGLHSKGYRVNRHGNAELMTLYQDARQVAQQKPGR